MCNLHRDLLPNIDDAYFLQQQYMYKNPHKHWAYAGPLANDSNFDRNPLRGCSSRFEGVQPQL